MAVAAFSTVVEWYDFTLYLYFATVVSRVFFGDSPRSLGLTLLGFAVSYLMRPVGAMIFGSMGDRLGRRVMMMLSMGLMSLAMLATALLPTYGAIGIAAGWLLLLLRCVMAFSVGGEYTGVVAYLVEGASPRRRGLVASTASAASEVGALLAVAVSAVTVTFVPPGALESWGWRIPFFVGAALAGGVLLARTTMDESPEFEETRDAGELSGSPVRDVLAQHKAAVGRTFALSALGSITYYVGITYVPSFLTTAGTLTEQDSLWLSTVAAVAVIVVTPLCGLLSDYIGRRAALVGVAVTALVLPVLMFLLMGSGSAATAVLGAVVMAGIAGGVSAIAAAATAEQFPSTGRLSGLALGTTMATAFFGGVTPWLAQVLLGVTGWKAVPGAMIAVVALCVTPVLVTMPETAPRMLTRQKTKVQ